VPPTATPIPSNTPVPPTATPVPSATNEDEDTPDAVSGQSAATATFIPRTTTTLDTTITVSASASPPG
jgi:hypothetical protein